MMTWCRKEPGHQQMCYSSSLPAIFQSQHQNINSFVCQLIDWWVYVVSSQWRHNKHNGILNPWRLHCLLNCWFRCRSKKTLKLRTTGICEGNSPVTGEFPSQKASKVENVSIWWHHHAMAIAGTTLVVRLSHCQVSASPDSMEISFRSHPNCNSDWRNILCMAWQLCCYRMCKPLLWHAARKLIST